MKPHKGYLFPGTLVKETLCGKIVQSEEVLVVFTQQQQQNDEDGGDCCCCCRCCKRTGRQIAIKMDCRSSVRHIHHGTQAPSENPWKEVAALQLLNGDDSNNNNKDNHLVVRLLDVLVDETYLYEIMPYYARGSLHDFLRHDYPQGMSEEDARGIFRQLIQAIFYIHSRGVCHRDISTHNIMLSSSSSSAASSATTTNSNINGGRIALIDFGMCLRVPHSYPDDDRTEDVTDVSVGTLRRIIHSQSHCGKLKFMAPEMYKMENFDGLAVDLWSAAVILFLLLTGKPPYDKPDAQADSNYYDLMDARFYWDPKSVAQVFSWGHAVSDEAVDLLKRAFQSDPRDRLTLSEIMEHPWIIQK